MTERGCTRGAAAGATAGEVPGSARHPNRALADAPADPRLCARGGLVGSTQAAELEERGRLLYKTKAAIEGLQSELNKARENEEQFKEQARVAFTEQGEREKDRTSHRLGSHSQDSGPGPGLGLGLAQSAKSVGPYASGSSPLAQPSWSETLTRWGLGWRVWVGYGAGDRLAEVEEGLAAAEEELRLMAEAREAETAEKARIVEMRGSAQTEIVRLQAEVEKRDGMLSRQADAEAALKRQVRGLGLQPQMVHVPER